VTWALHDGVEQWIWWDGSSYRATKDRAKAYEWSSEGAALAHVVAYGYSPCWHPIDLDAVPEPTLPSAPAAKSESGLCALCSNLIPYVSSVPAFCWTCRTYRQWEIDRFNRRA
jgi:hypothetical protein